jgi:SMC interacting uncharacterized protein involved in chromosome segregation
LGSTKSALASSQQEDARDKAQLRTSQDDLAKTKGDLEASQSQLATVQSNLDAANSQIATQNDTINNLKAQIAGLSGTGQTVTGPQGVPIEEYNKVNAELKDAQAQVAELNEVKDTLTGKVKDAESHADDLQKVVDTYKSHILRNGLEGEVLAVNQGWNFVVLSIGDRQGAMANAEMILERDGSQIGKVRITSVEPSTSVADIIPGSLARGVRVQPGDRVIFPGT